MGLTRTLAAVVFGSVLWMAAGGAVRASDETDLCRIPFTEAHRSAIEHQHVPALREVLEDWQSTGQENTRIGAITRDRIQSSFNWLDLVAGLIKAEDNTIGSRDGDASLPKRPGPVAPQSAFDGPQGPFAVALDQRRRDEFDAAMQALLHWACATEEPRVVNNVMAIVHDWRGDFFDIATRHPLSTEDWLQQVRILYRHIEAVAEPDADTISYLAGLSNELIQIGFNLKTDWFDKPDRADWRRKVRLDTADWVLSGSPDLAFRLGWVMAVIPFRNDGDLQDATGSEILGRGLAVYTAAVLDTGDSSVVGAAPDVGANLQFAEMAYRLGRPGLAACFTRKLDVLLSERGDMDSVGWIAESATRLQGIKRSMDERFAPQWRASGRRGACGAPVFLDLERSP